MPLSKERIKKILKSLSEMMPSLLQESAQIALQDTPRAKALVEELEANGYTLETQFSYTLEAIPMEMFFDRNLTESDRMFLKRLRRRLSRGKG